MTRHEGKVRLSTGAEWPLTLRGTSGHMEAHHPAHHAKGQYLTVKKMAEEGGILVLEGDGYIDTYLVIRWEDGIVYVTSTF